MTISPPTPSHSPPEDGGFKYSPFNGGPADTDVTRWIEDRANTLLRGGAAGVKRLGYNAALNASTTRQEDSVLPYVRDLGNVVDMDAAPRTAVIPKKRWPRFAKAGIDVDALAAQLQDDGAKSFVKSWEDLMNVITAKSATLKKAS